MAIQTDNGHEEGQHSAWIFQSNPDYFDLAGAVKSLTEMTWLIQQHQKAIHTGDRVFLWEAGKDAGVIAVATVLSEPSLMVQADGESPFNRAQGRFDAEELRVRIRVDTVLKERLKRQVLKDHHNLNSVPIITQPRGTNFILTSEQAWILEALVDSQSTFVKPTARPRARVTKPPLPKEVKWLLEIASRAQNIIVYGPPGTGKTWTVNQFAKAFTDAEKTRFVTFHQSFAYEEFIEGIRPVLVEGQVKYDVCDGIFKNICRAAQASPDAPYLLVIDEINRANIAKVLGELITLIEDDKRTDKDGRNENALRVTLPYSGETFGVPSNLTILGTMNTADRSIALLDLALRRRFTFVEMPPQSSLLANDVAGVDLEKLLTTLNARIAALLDKDHQIGHSYLMNLKDGDDLRFAWYNRLVPLLQEYFYGDGERLQAVLGKAFIQEIKLDNATRRALGDAYDDAPKFEVNKFENNGKFDDAAFLAALQQLAGQTQTGENS